MGLLNVIRRRWPCFLRRHAWRYRQAVDAEAAEFGYFWLLYGYRCVRCGYFEPMGVLCKKRMSSEEHAEHLRTGTLYSNDVVDCA